MSLRSARRGSAPGDRAVEANMRALGLEPSGWPFTSSASDEAARSAGVGSEAPTPGAGAAGGPATAPIPPAEWVRPEVLDSCAVALRRMGGASLTVIGVTSSVRGEGRSTVAAALAAIQATEYERRTVLVEFDLDKPSAAARFSLPEAPGVAEVLRGDKTIEECLQWPTDKLAVMVAGRVGETKRDLLRASVAEGLVERLSALPEVLVLDLPPLAPGAGGIQLVDLCQTVALVVRAGSVTKHQVESAVANLTAPPFVILNGTRDATPRWVRRLLGMAG